MGLSGSFRSYMAALRLPGYRWFWSGLLISALGAEIGYMALIWFVKELTGSSLAVGTVVSIRQIPLAVGSLLVGPLLDRGQRRALLAADNGSRALLMLLLCIAIYADRLALWHVYLVVGASGLASALTAVGRASITPALVGTGDLLPAANALNQVEWQLASLLGPAIGGMLLAIWQPAHILLIEGATLLFFAWSLVRLPSMVDQTHRSNTSYARSLLESTRFLLGTRPLLALTFLTFAFNFLYAPLVVALPFYVDTSLGYGALGLGWLWTAFAAGSLVGSLSAGALSRWSLGPSLAGIVVAWGLVAVPLLWVRHLVPALALMFLGGVIYAPYTVLYLTARQRLAPANAYGRVMGSTLVITQLGAPAGAWLGGHLVAQLGAPGTLGISGLACCVLGLIAWSLPDLRNFTGGQNGTEGARSGAPLSS